MKRLISIFSVAAGMLLAVPALGMGAEKTATGVITKPDATAFMYGTHMLQDDSGKTLYALKSDSINLGAFIGKKVTLRGELIAGYPLEGGPEYLDVTSVQPEKSR